jgi:predicted DNA-binding protein
MSEARTARKAITIVLSPEEHRRLRLVAAHLDLKLATFVRQACEDRVAAEAERLGVE